MADKHAERRRWRALVRQRQATEVERLSQAARSADDADSACLFWLGASRQAKRYLKGLDTRPGRWEEAAAHRAGLASAIEEAQAVLAAADPSVVQQGRSRLGMRLAVVGKGGAGKSLIAGTLARLLARQGRRVLAADFDTNPGLAYSLGAPPGDGALPDDAVAEDAGASYGWGLRQGTAPTDVVERHAVRGPDGVRFLTLGKIGHIDKDAPKRTVVALCELVAAFGEPDWDVIGDLEAGPTTPFERYHAFADQALVVVTPQWVSAMTARRLLSTLDDVESLVVANRFGDEPDHPGLLPVMRIPLDPDVADAERRGLAPLDACPDSPTVAAITRLADTLTHQEVPA